MPHDKKTSPVRVKANPKPTSKPTPMRGKGPLPRDKK